MPQRRLLPLCLRRGRLAENATKMRMQKCERRACKGGCPRPAKQNIYGKMFSRFASLIARLRLSLAHFSSEEATAEEPYLT